jgi:Flp pilus assembly protein TadG
MLTRLNRKNLRRLRKEKSGMAAVEFAFVAPIMLSFFFGLVEVGQALGCRADVINLASIGADLVAQKSTINDADMLNVFAALNAMMFPYDPSQAQITIYSIVDNGTSTGRVAWSCKKSGAASVNGPSSVPSGTTGGDVIAASNNGAYGGTGSVILANVTYTYTSQVGHYFIGSLTWTNNFYSKPRNVAQITRTAC